MGVLSKEDAHQSVHECVQLLMSIYNVRPILYTSWWAWKSLCGDGELAGDLPVWAANWTTYHTPLLPIPADEWLMWQFANAYPWPGQPKTADASRFNGNEVALTEYIITAKSLMYPEAPPPPPNGNDGGLPIYIELDQKRYVGEVREV